MTSRPSRAFRLGRLGGFASVFAFVACGEPAKRAEAPPAPAPSAAAPATSAGDAAPAGSALPSPTDAGAPAAGLPPGVPDTAAGHQLAWVMASFAQPPTETELAPHFTPDFTSHEPLPALVVLFGKLGAQLAPLAVDRVETGSTSERLVVVAHSDKPGTPPDAKMRIAVTVEESEPHRIAGLTFRRVIEAPPATSWDDVQTRLKAVAPSVGFLAAEMVAGQCTPLSSIEPKKPLALGSTFQLYILDALAKQVAAGKRKWDDPIAIEDAKRSLPPGVTRNEPAGKTFTARELAEKMISASDNTATDHLLAFVGRQAVEGSVRASGNSVAARDVPFLSTRDVFALKLLGSPDELRGYVAADVPHKRKILEAFEQRDLSSASADMGGWNKPRMVDSIEWFAAPEDLCKLAVGLKRQADAPATAPVGEILSINPGLPDDAGAFKYIGFKAGSEPGVMNMTWLLQRKSDDKWLFLAATFNDTGADIDDKRAVAATLAARDFLAK